MVRWGIVRRGSGSAAPCRLLAALTASIMLAGALLAGPGTTTAEASPAPPASTAPVKLSIASVTPSIVTANGNVTITGQVTNLTDQPISDAYASLWTSGRPLTTPAQLTSVLADPPTGIRLLKATQTFGDAGVLVAGQTADFTLTAAMRGVGTLQMTAPGAAYLIGVQMLGRATTPYTDLLASAYAVVSYVDPATAPQWTRLVALTSAPAMTSPANGTRPALFSDDHLATELSGRLKTLLDDALTPGMTVLIDPTLWQALTAMAQGYDVAGPGDTSTPGTGSAAAAAWLTTAAALLQRPSTYRTLAGDPDVAAAQASGRTDVLDATSTSPGDPLGSLPLAVVPRAGTCSVALLTYLAPVDPDLVVCGNEVAPTTLTLSAGVPVLGLTSRPSSPALDAWPGGAQALFDATVLLRSQAGQPVVLDAASPPPSPGLDAQLVGVSDLSVTAEGSQFAAAPMPAAGQDMLDATTAAVRDLPLASQLTGTDADGAAQLTRVIAGLWSTAWPPDAAGQAAAVAWARRIIAPVAQEVDGGSLELMIASTWHLSRPNDVMPVTIVNNYNLTAQVVIHFKSDNPQRLDIPDTQVITVAPGESAQVRVTPQAAGNGTVPVTATLVAADGTDLGAPPVSFIVNTSSAGRLGWVIIIAFGFAFLVATGLRVRQVRRDRGRNRPAPA